MAAGALVMAGCGGPASGGTAGPPAEPVREQLATGDQPTPSPTASPSPTAVPARGPGTFAYAAGTGPVLGEAGRLMRFRVAVEHDSGEDVAAFAEAVEETLGDHRSWIATRRWRLQRVDSPHADFTVYLATPRTTDRLCAPMDTEGRLSCRQGAHVVLNLARWRTGVPHFDDDLATYRQYLVNHEVGHRLGNGHERCPGKGQPAPVMQQQTIGLFGCTVNAWPYVNGKRHRGPRGSYS